MKPLLDLDLVTDAMGKIGFHLVNSEPGTMDSGFAEFSDGATSVTVCKDRSIWEFAGERRELEPLGLWKGYPDTVEFIAALLPYASTKKSAEQGGADQPATRSDSKPEGGEKPKPESEGRSQ